MAKKMTQKQKYGLEMLAIFVSGLGMLVLLTISVWVAGVVASGSSVIAEETIGGVPFVDESNERFAFAEQRASNLGRVAGVVDQSSEAEDTLRNEAMSWLGDVRAAQALPIAYRDGVLDRNAQNHARYLATSCSEDRYSDWSESLGTRIDEGYAATFSEAVFDSNGTTFAQDFIDSQIDYSRLFTIYDAVGVGVASYADAPGCGSGYVFVFHAASTR